MPITLHDVNFTYQKNTPFAHEVLTNLNLELPDNKFIAILGETGSGKTTALQLIKGLLKEDSGKIARHVNPDAIGYLFQYPEHQLFEETVAKDIAYGLINMGQSERLITDKTNWALTTVGLDATAFYNRSPFNLSGGQMRRVALAGVLAMQPQVMILDEPLAGLDPVGKRQLMCKLYSLHQKLAWTTLCVTHHLDDIWQYADYFVVFSAGKIIFTGERRQLLQAWQNNELELQAPLLIQLAQQLIEQQKINKSLPELEKYLQSETEFAKYLGEILC